MFYSFHPPQYPDERPKIVDVEEEEEEERGVVVPGERVVEAGRPFKEQVCVCEGERERERERRESACKACLCLRV
jgi:hypothetical protein